MCLSIGSLSVHFGVVIFSIPSIITCQMVPFFCLLCIFFLFPHTAVTLQLYKPCPSIRPLTIQSGRKQQLKCFRGLGSIQQLAPQRIQSANLNEKERGVKGKRRKKREEKEKLRKEINKSKEIKYSKTAGPLEGIKERLALLMLETRVAA